MSTHSPFSESRSGDFKFIYEQLVPSSMVDEVLAAAGPRNGGKPKLTAAQWFMGLTFHVLAGVGSFADHMFQLTGIHISDVALSLRKIAYPWEMFALLLEKVLPPLADPAKHPGAFYQGFRLTAIDGTKFNLRNTSRLPTASLTPSDCAKSGLDSPLERMPRLSTGFGPPF